ncbi:TIGR04376 family protein [Merismopedia glauca]|uniref:TIGR04376 family protein n=1 Tax=Merismopedia glauca CCAP 1448/3 TaxID=1296344 RepID=A0A2T1C7C0_9CYAN|nr:TIGR04376 family protein [Merismopedia glauca]PSB04151.1 TIGR04376 family protein [Merismopedia glauca CCAP 1448/3]
MGLFEDINQFLEERIEEFARNNPHLELQVLEEQLRQQEKESLRLIIDLQGQEKRSQDEILETAEQIKHWHQRIDKANAAGRKDLAQAAQEREAALLRQGNQLWGKMQGIKQQMEKAKELQRQIQIKRQELATQAAAAQSQQAKTQADNWETKTWGQNVTTPPPEKGDDLDRKFSRWETEMELQEMKRKMGR